MPEATCVICDAVFTPYVRRQTCCSKKCRMVLDSCKARAKKLARGERHHVLYPATCEECGVEFQSHVSPGQRAAGSNRGRYCSKACSNVGISRRTTHNWGACDCGAEGKLIDGACSTCDAARRRRATATERIRRAALGTAGPGVRTAGPCGICGKNFVSSRSSGSPYCSRRCMRSAVSRRRRARHAQAFVAEVIPHRIYERDGWRCQLCGKQINRTVVVPHPKAGVIDHVIPLVAGGTHEPANVQAAHFICNSIKSERTAPGGDQLRMIG